jgi:hypothetical protein
MISSAVAPRRSPSVGIDVLERDTDLENENIDLPESGLALR